ncbi:MAG: Hsp33 family molecular chaperone HslO [Spirochaetales bacterium]|nr:Hsp33 family molecular chaperone HslO [Spirochaetales bacterium]
MEKRKIYGNTIKERLLASKRDKMHQFLLADGQIRGVIVHGTKLVNEMRTNHELGILETMMLGYGYLGTLLLSSSLKGEERVVLELSCDGALKGMSVEANTFGEVRGSLKVKNIPVHAPLETYDLSPFIGTGILSVTKFLHDRKQPFSGKVEFTSGSFAYNLAMYSLESEQIPSSYSLSVCFDSEASVTGAGGLLVQAMPGADPGVITGMESIVNELPPIGKEFSESVSAEGFVLQNFAMFDPQFIAERRIVFYCHCSRERFYRFLSCLDRHELSDIAENGPFPVVLTCHNCNTNYKFAQNEITLLL